MTDVVPPRQRRPGPFPVAVTSLAAFLVVLALLAVQVRAGRDPALGPAPQAQVRERRQVIVRKVIVTRVVEDAPRAAAPSPAPVVRASAPAPAGTSAPPAAAPAPAPAAAPAPAPVTTRAS